MRWYIGFDDTDTLDSEIGTGRYARYFAQSIAQEVCVWGVVRHQLPQLADIPFTTHNSSACVVLETEDPEIGKELMHRAYAHVQAYYQEGSDPGLCIAGSDQRSQEVEDFGRRASARIVSQGEAYAAACGLHLSGHGGTEDGVIGALAAVGLTMSGWGGSFIDYADIRKLPERIQIRDLRQRGIEPVALRRKGLVPSDEQMVVAPRGIRPRLWAGRPVLPLQQREDFSWEPVDRQKKH